MAAFACHVEACGFESIVAVEHTVLATRYDSVYPYDPSGRVAKHYASVDPKGHSVMVLADLKALQAKTSGS